MAAPIIFVAPKFLDLMLVIMSLSGTITSILGSLELLLRASTSAVVIQFSLLGTDPANCKL